VHSTHFLIRDVDEKLYFVLYKSVPCYVHNYRLYPGWYTRELKGNIRSKERCYKNYKRFRAESDHKEYVRLRRLVKTQILRDSYIHLVENSVQKDPKGFWLYVHDRKDHTRIPAKMSHDDVTYNQPQDIINSFADYSISIYSTSSLPGKCTAGTYSNCLRPCFTLNKFDTSECDNVPGFLVRDCRNVLVQPLVHIFNLSLVQGTFPDIWKTAKTVPIHKGGNLAQIENYRPVALLSRFSKVFQIAIFNSLSSVWRSFLTP
jgi:hypothetical protein